MFDHVTLRASDAEASARFYETVLPLVGFGSPARGDGGLVDWGELSLYRAEGPDAVTRRLHVGLVAESRSVVDAFWQAGVDAGYSSDGEPGERAYVADYYGAFLLDPDGNSIEAMTYTGARSDGVVDHLWIRVEDVERSRAFYELVAPFGGFRYVGGKDGRATFSAGEGRGSFSLVPATDDWGVAQNLHVAFGGTSREVVDGFWQALVTEGGYRDHGGPGERPQYAPGYYGAFVLDPDGNNVEVVHHGA